MRVFNKSTATTSTAVHTRIWFLLLSILIQSNCFGQGKYLVLLNDKANSPYSVNKPEQFLSQRSILRRQKQNIPVRERDLPVNPAYITQLQQAGAKIWFPSRWLNAVLVEATDATLATIQKLPFVKGLDFSRSLSSRRISAEATLTTISKLAKVEQDSLAYGDSKFQVEQIGVDNMHRQGYHGEGMLIAVLDAGFRNANQVSFLKPLFSESRVLATYNFVRKETSVYEGDDHGLQALSAIAATTDNQLYGTAYKASFVLLCTEIGNSESRLEEANWLFGAEYADSVGVDVISSSLGYSTFDDASTSYTYQDMDGKTALSSRAAQIATETGMVVVVAAGNEGNKPWRYITAPSDAVSVLAIGAVTQTGQRASFSSFGPSPDGRVKPDLVARGQGVVLGLASGLIGTGNGTSFATPLVAGLAAGFWQAHPQLTAAQVTASLRRSGNQYSTPNDELGYGIPNFERASALAATYSQLLVYPNPFSETEPLAVQWGEIAANTPIEATLINLAGRVLWRNSATYSGLTTFVLPNLNLSAGLYFLTLVSGDKKRTVKVIKR